MNKTTVLTIAFAVLALAAGLFAQQSMQVPAVDNGTTKALAFSFPDISDKMQPISQWHGKIMVINFWATWCAPCLKEIPEFVRLQAEYQQQGLQFVGIALDDKQAVLEYLQRVTINYPILIAGDDGIGLTQQLGNIVGAVPFTLVVDQSGRMVFRQPGELSNDKLLEVITPLMAAK